MKGTSGSSSPYKIPRDEMGCLMKGEPVGVLVLIKYRSVQPRTQTMVFWHEVIALCVVHGGYARCAFDLRAAAIATPHQHAPTSDWTSVTARPVRTQEQIGRRHDWQDETMDPSFRRQGNSSERGSA